MDLIVRRDPSAGTATIGQLYIDGVYECYTLEDVVREIPGRPVAEWKVPQKTAIPAGKYRVTLDYSNRFNCDMPHILDVPGFDGIRIHPGNTPADTEGCILVGTNRSSYAIQDSRRAFDAFLPKLQAALQNDGEVWITICNAESHNI